jgi:hypothetical protein
MLTRIKEIGEEYQKRFKAINHWPEIILEKEDQDLLKRLPMIADVQRSSILIRSDDSHAYLPSQYILYAALIKEFAEDLYAYNQIIQNLKSSELSNSAIFDLINNRDSSNTVFSSLSAEEQSNFFDLFGNDPSQALGAKSILSLNNGKKGLRGDFFFSVILKVINVPDASSGLLGKLIYELCCEPDVYYQLQHKFLTKVPLLVQGSVIGAFANAVFRFLWSYDKLKKIKQLIRENDDTRFLSIEDGKNKLTSVFRSSATRLNEIDLKSGEKLRFAPSPSFTLDDKLIYISTEWTSGTGSRLDIDTLKSIVENHYPEFAIDVAEGTFTLLPSDVSGAELILHSAESTSIPKSFLLLAGISGTGKTQFIRRQAATTRPDLSNYQLIPVRPDWHEPSDLLGYVSRISGERYVPTPFLKFMVSAWCDAVERVDTDKIVLRPIDDITTFWACLDEMNLAPVEQYFSDYLAVLETRRWDGDAYTCDALVHPARLMEKNVTLPELQKSLGLEGKDALWAHFLKHGIPLPPNLIVAGTVNMDETTHGFSRKVIDRAFTIDFGEFFPNDFDKFFAPDRKPITLKFSRYSNANQADLAGVPADVDGTKSVSFLKEINEPLRGTPFELAFRAMNELLLAVKCFAPADEEALEAVWDDFLMSKLLPRIEGDAEKLRADGDKSLLTGLGDKVKQLLTKTIATGTRPDLLNTDASGATVLVPVRSLKKIQWMQDRLTNNAFTSFWP